MDGLGLPCERLESVLGLFSLCLSPLGLPRPQTRLPPSFLFPERFLPEPETAGSSRSDASSSSSSQGAREWTVILGPYVLILGSSSSLTAGETSSSLDVSMEEHCESSSKSRLLALGKLSRSLSDMGERGAEDWPRGGRMNSYVPRLASSWAPVGRGEK